MSAQGGKNVHKEQALQRKIIYVVGIYLLFYAIAFSEWTDFDMGEQDCILSALFVYDEEAGGAVVVDVGAAAETCELFRTKNEQYVASEQAEHGEGATT